MSLPRAVHDRLDALAAEYDLPQEAPAQLAALLRLIRDDDTAPTTVRDPEAAVDAHVADALTGLQLARVREATTIADLGAGAGFPGLVLAAALPGATVRLVESLSRKCAFLERAIATTGITNAGVVCARAEEWREGIDANDVVTVRAVAPLNVLAEYAAPLLKDRGALVAWKGIRDAREEADGDAAAAELGLEAGQIHPVEPFPGAHHRHLYVYLKVRETPSRFPRRPGMARKRPLSTRTRG